MAQMVGTDESLEMELTEIRRSLSLGQSSSFRNTSFIGSSVEEENDAEVEEEDVLQWAAIERLPTFQRLRSSLFHNGINGGETNDEGRRVIDVTKLQDVERHLFIDKLIKHTEKDNFKLLRKLKERVDRVGVKFPTIEVAYKDLHIEAKCKIIHGRALPTLWNSVQSKIFDIIKYLCSKPHEATIDIIEKVSGVIKPGRLTLLLGPPGCGKTTLLKALSGNLNNSLKITGEVCYNGNKLKEFVPQKASAYISQYDQHISEMTVRETLDFSARCQGIGSRADILREVSEREKEEGIVPDPDVDTYMKAISVGGQERSLQTDYILKILGLDICADTLVGDAMSRGISGGQKKRLTTGEMIVGPNRALFMDEITNGLDNSTAFQIIACLQHFAHLTDSTVLVSLLQPAPEIFNLFDDIILMAEKKIIYHGPCNQVLQFFEDCGYRCPERKDVVDFLQEVISRKDQAQLWCRDEVPYTYISVDAFSRKFMSSDLGRKLDEEISKAFDKSQTQKNVSFSAYSPPKWELFIACASRELLLMKRNLCTYAFKTSQLIIIAFITMMTFLQTRTEADLLHANYYMGSLFYVLLTLLVDGIPEIFVTIQRLEIFYKQKQFCFYPEWAYSIPTIILNIPLSVFRSLVWTALTYYVIGYSPEANRFFRQFLLFFAVHFSSVSMFRLLASVFQTKNASATAGSYALMLVLIFGGFIITQPSMPSWLKWGFWVSPIAYGEIGLSVNEFLAPRWQQMRFMNTTVGHEVLKNRGLNYDEYFYWISLGALFGFAIVFNICFTLALNFLKPPGSSHATISYEKLLQAKSKEATDDREITNIELSKGKVALPFTPSTIVFQDLQYYVDVPPEMRRRGFGQKKLQLLCDISGALRPGILTALMGASGAGKTTLLDVLAGRKTSGYVEGEIKIGGFPKVQETFTRIFGYCEQTDIHSPQITVLESLIFSASLRLAADTDSKTKTEFVKEVLDTIELDSIKDSLVGVAGVNGLSIEQRKRLTIAVELVSNPSVIFMDEPTTGLDARAAAIVMRAVKNVVDTGRTIVCTIHQPSINIFELFDELILLKMGGRMIYNGPLGQHSNKLIEYFEGIPSVSKIKENYNPATWILEVTSSSVEAKLGIDFAQIYRNSALYENNKELVKQLSIPHLGSRNLHFPKVFPHNFWGQFKACLWKQNLSYWRSPFYNLRRFMHTIISSIICGLLFWNQGKKLENQQNMLNICGSMFSAMAFIGINNCVSVLPYISMERTVMYRERFAGMYSSWAYSLSQITVELPYLFVQAVVYVIITYPMIGYYGSAYKIFWYFYSMFCTLLYFNYLGLLLVSSTPNFQITNISSSALYAMCDLFAGFVIPKPQIPKWMIWLYYMMPTSWTLNAFLTSQYGDIDQQLTVFGVKKQVSAFLRDYFGFHYSQLPLVGVMLILFPIIFALLFGFCIGRLNFQRR